MFQALFLGWAIHHDILARQAEPGIKSVNAQIDQMEHDLNMTQMDLQKALMICEALWTILKEKHGCQDEELIHRIEEIDKRNQRKKGSEAEAVKCPRCGRNVGGRLPRCLYCGAEIERGLFDQ